jgi:hypothetical protein
MKELSVQALVVAAYRTNTKPNVYLYFRSSSNERDNESKHYIKITLDSRGEKNMGQILLTFKDLKIFPNYNNFFFHLTATITFFRRRLFIVSFINGKMTYFS